APWCGPCKQLGPVLEKVVRGANGAVRMVKLNIDENPEIAQQMRIQSIPAVYAFKDGRPVDGFVGALPESQVKQFVQRLGGGAAGPSPIEKAMTGAGKLKSRVEQNPDDHEARFELATALFGSGEREAAIDELLTLFKRDRKWNDEAARKQLVKFFEVMGPTDPLTLSARRRLSALMFA